MTLIRYCEQSSVIRTNLAEMLVFLLLISFVAINRSEDSIDESSGTDPNVFTASIGPFLIEDEWGKRRECSCSEITQCSVVYSENKVRDSCASACAHNLAEIDNNTSSLLECFNDKYLDEFEAGEKCVRSEYQNLCFTYTDKKAPSSLQFDTPISNPLHHSTVSMKKAAKFYDSIRKYQSCFSGCYYQKEQECRGKLRCTLNYPGQQEIEKIYSECLELQQTIFDNARIACKCMISRHNIVKLVGLCSLFSDLPMAHL